MITKFELPGAPNFTKYLLDILGDKITSEVQPPMTGEKLAILKFREGKFGWDYFLEKVRKTEGDDENYLRSFDDEFKDEIRKWNEHTIVQVMVDTERMSEEWMGIYCVYQPLDGDLDFGREYLGIVPDKKGLMDPCGKESFASLRYARGFKVNDRYYKNLPFKRFDDRPDILFP